MDMSMQASQQSLLHPLPFTSYSSSCCCMVESPFNLWRKLRALDAIDMV
jgi:hypothetical protein